ncbi:hypothetical protein [Magnetospirillum sp. ME-1]|uniref:hypothetical protein n=1 Tax=Magnetospirillum sp. ME-1 TaxID=1639348 RepID=UPI0011AE96C3|nr:hypothetical protein [Magnetospirillum sp. ME-1]
MAIVPTLDVRALRAALPLKEDHHLLGWLDLHARLVLSPDGAVVVSQRELADDWRRPETTVRRFLARLSEAGWISLVSSGRRAVIRLASPPCFVIGQDAGKAAVDPFFAPIAEAPRPPAPAVPVAAAAPLDPDEAFAQAAINGVGEIPRVDPPAPPVVAPRRSVVKQVAPQQQSLFGLDELSGMAAKPMPEVSIPAAADEAAPKRKRKAPAKPPVDPEKRIFVEDTAALLHEEHRTDKGVALRRLYHLLSPACGFGMKDVEAAIEVMRLRDAEEIPLENPLSFIEWALKKPEEAAAYADKLMGVGAPAASPQASVRRLRSSPATTARMVTTAEEMGVTAGMAAAIQRNADLANSHYKFAV